MNGFLRLVIVVGLICGADVCAEEPLPTVESVVAAWSEASRECRSLEAKLVVYTYDRVFGDGPTTAAGRYRYEMGGDLRLHVAKRDDLVRRGKTIWVIDRERERFQQLDLDELAKAASDPPLPWYHWLGNIYRGLGQMYRTLAERGGLPFLMLPDAERLTSQYALELCRDGDRLLMHARPKDATNAYDYTADLWFAWKNAEPLPFAVRHFVGAGTSVTYVLDEVRVNETPPDRDAFMQPDLMAYREIRMDLRTSDAK